MSKEPTGWFPSDLMDEVMPPGRPSPSAWIVALDDGATALDLSTDFEPVHHLLNDGDTVAFASRTDYGEATLTLTATDYSVSAEKPAGAEQCCALDGWQSDTLASDVAELVGHLRDCDQTEGEFRIAYYTFSDDIPYRFDAASKSFVRVTS